MTKTDVDKLFAYYENRQSKTFHTPYSDYQDLNGKRFHILRRLTEKDADIEVLPMWCIETEDGVVIHAFPEEICDDGYLG
jgi:hypothetical protein